MLSKNHIRTVEIYNNGNTHQKSGKNTTIKKDNIICQYCSYKFTRKDSLNKHIKDRCKVKKELDEKIRKEEEQKKEEKDLELNKLLVEITKMREEQKKKEEEQTEREKKMLEKIEMLETMVIANNKNFELLQKSYEKFNRDNEFENFLNNNIEETEKIDNKLISLEIKEGYTIVSREQDNYVDVTNLCKAGNKEFKLWFINNKTKEFIKELSDTMGIPIDDLIKYDINTWVHPQIAINIAQWISPSFNVKVSKWISDILSDKKILIENKSKNNYIKKLQKKILKKQPRIQYKEENVIYLLTTYELEKKRIYILGKATNLTKRLTNYNKSEDHKVVYYRTCNTRENMDIIEKIILQKLEKYKEKVNRERVILPELYPISFFKNIIDESIDFIIKPINNKDTIVEL